MELQTNVVEKRTFELLKKLMNDDALKDYFLVGGTALALRMGQRKTFLSKDFSFYQMLSFYASKFSDSNIMSVTRALTYYNDIDFSDEPVELTRPELFSWEKISQRLTMMVDKPNVKFTCYPILPLQNSN